MENHFFFKCNQKIVKLDQNAITHILVDDYVITIHCLDRTTHSNCSSLKKIEVKLPSFFKKISRNCLVNTNLIQSIHNKEKKVTMQNDHLLYVAKSKWNELKEWFIKF